MTSWLKEMGKQWLLSTYALLSFGSTVATYIKSFLPGHLGIWLGVSGVAAFVAAAVRVDLKRQEEIIDLTERVESQTQSARKAQLVIHPGPKPMYMLLAANEHYPLPPRGIHVEMELSIENKGRRNALIKKFGINLPEFKATYVDIHPYFPVAIRGLTSHISLGSGKNYWKPGEFIRVDSESVSATKRLAFEITDLPLANFGKPAFDGDRETRVFPPILCQLTLTDTEGSFASHEFLLNEFR